MGFARGKASPCIFHHKGRDLRVVVHGDDFTELGGDSELDWLKEQALLLQSAKQGSSAESHTRSSSGPPAQHKDESTQDSSKKQCRVDRPARHAKPARAVDSRLIGNPIAS